MRRTIDLVLNGEPHSVEAEESASLLDVLRGPLGVSGARFGCGLGQCGACAVLIDGREEAACTLSIEAAAG